MDRIRLAVRPLVSPMTALRVGLICLAVTLCATGAAQDNSVHNGFDKSRAGIGDRAYPQDTANGSNPVENPSSRSGGKSRVADLVVLAPTPAGYGDTGATASREDKRLSPSALDPVSVSDLALQVAMVCVTDEQCSDCNPCTQDLCSAGVCSNPPEPIDAIRAGCDDGVFCNGDEVCDGAGTCVPGTEPCDWGPAGGTQSCDETARLCGVPCASDAACDDGDGCTEDICDVDTLTCGNRDICTAGRCCTAGGTCSSETEAACTGSFLATSDACSDISDSQGVSIINDCPDYSAGIAPQGDWIGGSPLISALCGDVGEYRDQYETKDHATLPVDEQYMLLELLRFTGAVRGAYSARWNIAIYDENGVLVEDVFWPAYLDQVPGDWQINSISFDPPLVIPTKGEVGFSVQTSFSPGGLVQVRLTGDGVDVGVNWGGDGEIVGMELVGTLTAEPRGACCDTSVGSCTMELPWVCDDLFNIYQGDGSACGICQDGPAQFNDCIVNSDCNDVCDDLSLNAGEPCVGDGDCDGGLCDQSGGYTCVDLPTCLNQACCNAFGVDGGCVEAAECSGNGGIAQGFGTTCEPNCCTQSLATGADECNASTPILLIVPPVGNPPVTVTVTGNNSTATADSAGVCDVFDSGGSELGWWEAFDIIQCADVRIDLCCTDIAGEVLVPAWAFLVEGCDPCGDLLEPSGVFQPVGIGVGTLGFGYGGPFCAADNFWATFGPLAPGTYFYPIYSSPDGNSGVPPGATYQLHISAQACAVAACCTGESCFVGNALECDAAGGYWLAPPNVGVAVLDCSGSPCSQGSCCTGPGTCVDELLGGPLTSADCDAIGGGYIGGALCNNPVPPSCPLCFISDPANCQIASATAVVLADVDRTGLPGLRADDFIATSNTLSTVCVTGAWLDSQSDCGTERCDCACVGDSGLGSCTEVVAHAFTVSVYTAGSGAPGVLLGTSSAAVSREIDSTFVNFDLWSLSLGLDTPIGGLSPGTEYWIEVYNNTDSPTNNTCDWYWAVSEDGNQWSASGSGTSPGVWRTEAVDLAMCLDSGLDQPPAPVGACCDCPPGSSCTNLSQADCQAGGGAWYGQELCETFTCPNATPVGDDCAGDAQVVTNSIFDFDTNCGSTDGPSPVSCGNGDVTFGSDIWFEYIATCSGTLLVTLCDQSDYDSILAVYGDGSSVCSCPTDATNQLSCNDNGCGDVFYESFQPRSNVDPPGECRDPACTSSNGASTIMLPVREGDCYTVRLGGVNGASGSGTVELRCLGPVFVDADAVGDNNGTTWSDAYSDLQDAIDLADTWPGLVREIWVAEGEYRPDRNTLLRTASFELGPDVTLLGGFIGSETDRDQRDPTTNVTILTGDLAGNDGGPGTDAENSYHVVTTSSADELSVLDGFRITGGNANGSPGDERRGGGVFNDGGSPAVRACTLENNVALQSGGAMYSSGGRPRVIQCVLEGNSAMGVETGDGGGGIFLGGGNLSVYHSKLISNTATEGGGGIQAVDGRAFVVNSEFRGNDAQFGGAINNGSSFPALLNRPSTTVLNCTLSENTATDLVGGGLATDGGTLIVRNTILWGNLSDINGSVNSDQDAQLTSGADVSYSCIEGLDGSYAGNGNIGDDPLFISAIDLRLRALSPCLDSGDATVLPVDRHDLDEDGDVVEAIPFDLSNLGRVVNEGEVPDNGRWFDPVSVVVPPEVVDIGAYERHVDCNSNGVFDECDLGLSTCLIPSALTGNDCNHNGAIDSCEIQFFSVPDCDSNGVPDDCDPDCNANSIPDICEIPTSSPGGVCTVGCDPDCNANSIPDFCDVLPRGPWLDCTGNGVPDACDIAAGDEVDDVAPFGVPDSCRPNATSGNWTADIWSLSGGYPDNADSVPDLEVTVSVSTTVTVDDDISIDVLRLDPASSLRVDNVGAGDLNVGVSSIVSEGELTVDSHVVTAVGLELANGGTVKVGGIGTRINLQGGAFILDSNTRYESDSPSDPVDAALTAGRIEILPTSCAEESQLSLRPGMVLESTGDLVMDGTGADCFLSRSGGVARGGKTPPIIRISPPMFLLGDAGRVAAPAATRPPLAVQGDIVLRDSAQFCVGGEIDGPDTCSHGPQHDRSVVHLEGDFVNHSWNSRLFNWSNAHLVLNGSTDSLNPQVFEVAGVDLGQPETAFDTDVDTNRQTFIGGDTHGNFSIDMLEVAAGMKVKFVNNFANTAGTASGAEALYVRELILGDGSEITLDNSRVYYSNLQDLGSTVIEIGSGELLPTCSAPPGDVCSEGMILATNGTNAFVNTCAGTDGPNPVLCAPAAVDHLTTFGKDIWYSYTATCTGILQVNMCDFDLYDSVIAAYHDISDPTVCSCPTSSATQLNLCDDDGCGIGGGPSAISVPVVEGLCYTIRIAGWASDDAPRTAKELDGHFNISCGQPNCLPPAPLELTADGGVGGLNPVGTRGFGFVGGTPAVDEAIRVTFLSGPNTGMALWVQPPLTTGEASGGGAVDPNPANNFQWSDLGCTPFFAQWSGYTEGVYVKSDQLTPGVQVLVQAVADGACSADEANYSPPLSVLLSGWGDLLGCGGPDCTLPPDGNTDFSDISGIIDKFKNVPGAIRKWRADVDPAFPNGKIDFTDIPLVVDGFRGFPYPFAIPADPCAP